MIRRGKWVPFLMRGPISLEKGHMLIYSPNHVEVDNNDATPILAAANVLLQELLTVKAPGAELIGSTVYLDALKLFPPPKLSFSIRDAKLEERGLVLSLATAAKTDVLA